MVAVARARALASLASLGFSGPRRDNVESTPRGPQGRKVRTTKKAPPRCRAYGAGGGGRYRSVYDKIMKSTQKTQYKTLLTKINRVNDRVARYDIPNHQPTRNVMRTDIVSIQKFMKSHAWAPHWNARHHIFQAFDGARRLVTNTENTNNTNYSPGNVADLMFKWGACAIDIVCHAFKVKVALATVVRKRRDQERNAAARVIQKHFIHAKYSPDGAFFHAWANQSAARRGMKA